MIHELTRRLIDQVHAQTLAGEIQWDEGPSKGAFGFEADDYSIAVEADASTATLVISDSSGRELETVGEEDLAACANAHGADYETIVREIYSHARRSALGTDHAIERILNAIQPGAERPRRSMFGARDDA